FAEDAAADADVRDVNAIHFNIQTVDHNFQSSVTFKPKHTFAGVGVDYRQYLHCRNACDKRWWMEISTPLLWVKNKIEIEETPLNTTSLTFIDGSNKTVVEAFKGEKPFV